jgi:tetratricopeptide (TPR) repeat protein
LLKAAFVFVATLTWGANAQIYQVGGGAASPQKQTNPSQPAAQSPDSSLGWGSNIQNARLAGAAEQALARGNPVLAYDYAQKAVNAAPNDPQLWFLLGYAARLDGKYQESIDAYSHGLRLRPSSLDGLSGLAQVDILIGKSQDAERLLRQVVASDPKRNNELVMLGEISMRSKDYRAAIDWLERAEQIHPEARSELLLALSYEPLKQMDQANRYLTMAEHRDPNNPEVERSLAGYYRDAGKYPEAIALLQSIPNPKPDITAELAYTFQLDGKLDQSAATYAKAAHAEPNDPNLQLAAAQAEIAAGSVDQANAFLERVQALHAGDYRYHAIRGQIAQLEERDEDAVNDDKAALAALPANPAEGPLYGIQLHMNLEALYHNLGDESDARSELQIAQDQIRSVGGSEPESEPLLRLRAQIKMNAGDLDGALSDIKGALAIRPADRSDLQLDGDILMKMGRPEDAIAMYRQVLAKNPADRFALTSLGFASRTAGRDEEAEHYFERLAAVDPSLYIPYLALGDLYTARREFTKAQAAYNKGYAIAPGKALIVAGGMNAGI